MLASIAEGELETTKARVNSARARFRREARWSGGTAPYGTRPVQQADKTWRLEHDTGTAPVLRELITRALRGDSPHAIAIDLNERGIPAQKGGGWFGGTVRNLLKSRTLLGEHTWRGQVVRGEDGTPVVRYPPFLSEAEFAELQARLEDRARGAYRRQSPNLLLRVAFCGSCDTPLSRYVNTRPYHRCARYAGASVPARRGLRSRREGRTDLRPDRGRAVGIQEQHLVRVGR
ncbi:recombinase family protein [Pilimelia columellifera]|uniref:recombinase family protein n=1 Tax=Pilimelia columellifera TaxID=706574 RepID=UPI003CD0B5B9